MSLDGWNQKFQTSKHIAGLNKMNRHKYGIGTKINACLDEWGNWGNGLWVWGRISNLCFLNGQPAYDIIDEQGNTVHNIPQSTIQEK